MPTARAERTLSRSPRLAFLFHVEQRAPLPAAENIKAQGPHSIPELAVGGQVRSALPVPRAPPHSHYERLPRFPGPLSSATVREACETGVCRGSSRKRSLKPFIEVAVRFAPSVPRPLRRPKTSRSPPPYRGW